jgi:hypothetical protein
MEEVMTDLCDWGSMPQENFGKLYMTFRAPLRLGFYKQRLRYKCTGQCLGDWADGFVNTAPYLMRFLPDQGKDWTWLDYEAIPDNPTLYKGPLNGKAPRNYPSNDMIAYTYAQDLRRRVGQCLYDIAFEKKELMDLLVRLGKAPPKDYVYKPGRDY